MQEQLEHRLTLLQRERMQLTGVEEVISFDEDSVVLKTNMGLLTVHGQALQLKTLSLDGGQVDLSGTVDALIYQAARPAGGLRRLFK